MKHGKGRWKKKSSHFVNDDNISVSKNVHNQYDGYHELNKKHGYENLNGYLVINIMEIIIKIKYRDME